MIFEVDNTTELLIKELQDSIKETIESLNQGQNDIREMTRAIRGDIEEVSTSAQIDALSSEIRKISEKIEPLFEDSEESPEIVDNLNKIVTMLNNFNQGEESSREALSKIDSDIQGIVMHIGRMVRESDAKSTEQRDRYHNEQMAVLTGIERIKSELSKMHVKDKIEKIDGSVTNIRNNVETVLSGQAFEKESIDKIMASIAKIEEQLNYLERKMVSEVLKLSEKIDDLVEKEEKNSTMLVDLIYYMRKPGITRLFKGM